MMIPSGLDQAGMTRLGETLCMDHNVRIVVSLMDLNHNHLANLTHQLYDGQVNISSGGNQTSRSAKLSIWDPDFQLGLDIEGPDGYANFYTKMVRITYCVWRWGDVQSVDIPIFTGPITATSRDGQGFLELTCMGKEVLGKGVMWWSTYFYAGQNIRDMILELMREEAGEAYFNFETNSSKLAWDVQHAAESVVWDEAYKEASSLGMHMFYDGYGVCRLRKYPSTMAWVFRDGPGGSIVTKPTRDNSDDTMKNKVWYIGGTPEGSGAAPEAISGLAASHPLSPENLGRYNDQGRFIPRILLEYVEDTEATTYEAAQAGADATLGVISDGQQLNVKADVLAIPFLEEQDLIGITMNGQYSQQLRLLEYTIPLSGPIASLGSLKNLSLAKVR